MALPDNGPERIAIAYFGTAGRLFWLALKTVFLTLLTLGIYRFWMKTRIRRHFWSGTEIGGEALEYTGTGLEKLLGFLIAVVFLAVYLGIFQVLLSFAGMAVLQGAPAALNLSVLLAVPLIFYASYRARRYILSRTRWRGVRFGMQPGAASYMVQALGHLFVTVVTAGFLYPRQVFNLERFTTRRTRYGDLTLEQEGSWTALLWPWLLVYVAFAVTAGLIVLILPPLDQMGPRDFGLNVFVFVMAYSVFTLGLLYFRVEAFRIMTGLKRAGHKVRFRSTISLGRLLGIYSLGGVILMTLTFLLALAVLMASVWIAIRAGVPISYWDFEGPIFDAGNLNLPAVLPLVITYVSVFLALAVFGQVLISQPVWRHYAEELTLIDSAELDAVSQRDADDNVEAEGFADALDVGAAF